MLDPFYEIVVLADGDVVLRRADGHDRPLVRISFSEEARAYNELQAAWTSIEQAASKAGVVGTQTSFEL